MDINSLTVGEVKELQRLLGGSPISASPLPDCGSHCGLYKIGQAYFIRTVTMSYTGIITAVHQQEIELSSACWIADSGRFHKALKGEWDSNAEHEPFPAPIGIGRGAIVDFCPLSCTLPKDAK
jgi:hypothetical protein